MKPTILKLSALCGLFTCIAFAQETPPVLYTRGPDSSFVPVTAPTPTPAPEPAVASTAEQEPASPPEPIIDPAIPKTGTARDAQQPSPETAAAEAPETIPTPTPMVVPPSLDAPPLVKPGELRLNFQNAALADVLSYLSEAAGLIVLQPDTPVSGLVTVVSKQPVTIEEATNFLDTVLNEKGYAAIRNGRVLKIVPRSAAAQLPIPVIVTPDPEEIPLSDSMVTQIIPVRYVEASKLVENLKPLLSPEAILSANEASNALILADTQINVRRIAQIVKALDTSISNLSTIRVFPLQYSDSKSVANMISQVFTSESGPGNMNAQNRGGRLPNTPPWMQQAAANATKGAAQTAATRVIAVSDDQSNSVIVNAPEAAMSTIAEIISKVDTNINDATETRTFMLKHADAFETANVLNALYSETGSTNPNNRRPAAPPPAAAANLTARTLQQARVILVADPRTNSLIVTASRDTMDQIAQTIAKLDSTDAKKQRVYVYPLDNADPDSVAYILRSMFSTQVSGGSTYPQAASDTLLIRSRQGASTNMNNVINPNSR